MSKADKIELKLIAKNIGPHVNTQISTIVKRKKIGLFAMNGEGKSFLSRTFSLAQDTIPDYVSSDSLISFGSDSGEFQFSWDKADCQKGCLSISLKKGSPPYIKNDTGFRFHVFNQDYVKNNLEKCSYSPSGNYEGYVVGKENIDISHEEEEIERLNTLGKSYKKELELEIKKARKILMDLGVRANTTELGYLVYEKILSKKHTDEIETYDHLLEQYNKLKTLPEGISDIQVPEFAVNYSFLQKIVDLLNTEYNKAKFSDEFLDKVRGQRMFIERGMQQINIDDLHECPFCGQKLESGARALIHQYSQYLEDEESKILQEIEGLEKACDSLASVLKNETEGLLRSQSSFDKLKVYFPSYQQKQLTQPPEINQYSEEINKLIHLLRGKKKDISLPIYGADEIVSSLARLVKLLDISIAETKKEVTSLNQSKNNINTEQLTLRKRLCKAKYNDLLIVCNSKIDAVIQAREDLRIATENLKVKQAKKQISKGELVSRTFSSLLRKFFDNKYELSFNKSIFNLTFKAHTLSENAETVLSDGEKGIVAFCYYLASTHLLVNKEDDYQEVLFIIDDPISSMDFNYVYTLAQILRTIDFFFPTMASPQMLIFTHSVEFVGVLCRNNVLSNMLSLHSGNITPINGELILPYEQHLKDIYQISIGDKKATHTTGNSLRHVLETLWRFERPDLNSLRDYFDSLSDIKEKSYLLYALSNDLSHGAVREEFPVDSTTMQKACIAVIDLVTCKCSGQITRIKKELST